MSRIWFRVGDLVVITARSHPHYGESGVIEEAASGGAVSVGLDWSVKLNGAWAGGCFVSEDEIRHV